MKTLFALALLAASSTAAAVVIRDDVADDRYLIPAEAFPALADMPGEAHGVLIAPRWVVTAAHVVGGGHVHAIELGGVARPVRQVIVHAGYRPLPDALVHQALTTGDLAPVAVHLSGSDDIALVELEQPVTDIAPVPLFRGDDELGRTVRIIGKGATGTGAAGEAPHSPHRTALRRAENVITDASERWITYLFDAPATALPLEGQSGSGDSGGAVLVEVGGEWQLAGLTSWKYVQGDARDYRPGRYGDAGNNVRISRYLDWIEATLAAPATATAPAPADH